MEIDASDLISLRCQVSELIAVDDMQQDTEDHHWLKYWDDTNGKELRADLVKEARMEEIQEVRRMKDWTKIPRAQCLSETGKKPIQVRWVDRSKKDETNPQYRSRIVAKEIKTFANPDLFAATPPVEYIRFLLSCVASSQWSAQPTRLMVQDVSKAYFFADATRRVFVEIPEEDFEPGDEHRCALLLKSLCGTCDAALNRAECYTSKLLNIGFSKGASSPCTFHHATRNIKLVVHGDDFVSEGSAFNLAWLDASLKKEFIMKSQVLGPDKGETRELTILNRVIRWTDQGLSWEPDARHAEAIIRDMEIFDGKGVCSPGVKDPEKRKSKESRAEDNGQDAGCVDQDGCLAGGWRHEAHN